MPDPNTPGATNLYGELHELADAAQAQCDGQFFIRKRSELAQLIRRLAEKYRHADLAASVLAQVRTALAARPDEDVVALAQNTFRQLVLMEQRADLADATHDRKEVPMSGPNTPGAKRPTIVELEALLDSVDDPGKVRLDPDGAVRLETEAEASERLARKAEARIYDEISRQIRREVAQRLRAMADELERAQWPMK